MRVLIGVVKQALLTSLPLASPLLAQVPAVEAPVLEIPIPPAIPIHPINLQPIVLPEWGIELPWGQVPVDQDALEKARKRLMATPIGPARRIWDPVTQEHQTLWMRRTFELDGTPTKARLVVSCDNEAVVYVNGKRVAMSDSWENLVAVDLGPLLDQGKNSVAVLATNTGSCAALALWMTWTLPDGTTEELVSDGDWKVQAADPAGEHGATWMTTAFDDSGWGPVLAEHLSPLGTTVHATAPKNILFTNRHADAIVSIAEALEALRMAPDNLAAMAALDRIDRAVMHARKKLWEHRRGTASPAKPRSHGR